MKDKTIKSTMRDAFLGELYRVAKEDRDVILITNDLGAVALDSFRRDLSSQFIHGGISEQNQVNVAAGLAMEGKRVFLYSITPFLPLRCLEQIRVHLCFSNLPVTMVGLGAGFAYDRSGPTHHAVEDIAIMRALPNMTILTPSDSVMAEAFARMAFQGAGPKYIRLDRGKLPTIYGERFFQVGQQVKVYGQKPDFSKGLAWLREGNGLVIVATGYMVHRALEVAERLDAGVVDLYRIPVNEEALLGIVEKYDKIVTLEEHFVNGGIGSVVAEVLNRRGLPALSKWLLPLKCIGVPQQYYFAYGGRAELHKLCRLDTESVVGQILAWVGS